MKHFYYYISLFSFSFFVQLFNLLPLPLHSGLSLNRIIIQCLDHIHSITTKSQSSFHIFFFLLLLCCRPVYFISLRNRLFLFFFFSFCLFPLLCKSKWKKLNALYEISMQKANRLCVHRKRFLLHAIK